MPHRPDTLDYTSASHRERNQMLKHLVFPETRFEITDIDSSYLLSVKFVALNTRDGDLEVAFRNGSVYTYEKVSISHALKMLIAHTDLESVGSEFNDEIRYSYDGVKVK